jgi:phage tail-like protein
MSFANPRKNFRYLLELDGVNMFQIQEITPPTVEFTEVTHGAPGNIPDGKTPGKIKVGDLVVKKLCLANSSDTWAWDWFGLAVAGAASEFRKTGFLKHLGIDGVTTVDNYFLGNIWPKKIEGANLNSAGNENYIETVTFSVQLYFPKDSPLLQALFAGSAARAGGAAFLAGFSG